MKFLSKTFIILAILLTLAWIFQADLAIIYLTNQRENHRLQFLANSPEKEILKYQNQLMSDASLLNKYSFFTLGSLGQSDASHLLNPLMPWPNYDQGFAIPESVKKEVNENFPKGKLSEHASNLDLGFVEQLRKYDHWNLEAAGPYFNKKTYYLSDMLLEPNFEELIVAGKKLLLAAQSIKQSQQALEDHRHLARLLFTTDTYAGVNSALTMLKNEYIYYNALPESQQKQINWVPIPENAIQAAQRFSMAQPALTDIRVSNEVFLLFYTNNAFRCYRSRVGLMNALSYRLFLREEFNQSYDRLNQFAALTRQACRKGVIQKVWQQPDRIWVRNAETLSTSIMTPLLLDDETLITNPEVGKAEAYYVLSAMKQPWFKAYQANLSKEN